jgi:hypothetical protein
MANSNPVNPGDSTTALQYNNLRKDVLDTSTGHTHAGDSAQIGSTPIPYRNTAIGTGALKVNTTGNYNTAIGAFPLLSNTTGYYNVAVGSALQDNTIGNGNTSIGHLSLQSNTTGNYNTSIGTYSLQHKTQGDLNTAIGYNAGADTTDGTNNTMIGRNAQVPNLTGSNQIRVGDTNITYAGIQIAWTITSDKKYKKDIRQLELGLDFINELNPVEYKRINTDKNEKEFGFIAQDIEEILNKNNIKDSGMITKDDNGYLHLRYNDIIPILTKAIQELSKKNNELEKRIQILEA